MIEPHWIIVMYIGNKGADVAHKQICLDVVHFSLVYIVFFLCAGLKAFRATNST